MNQDKMRLWVDALRSGEYEQARSAFIEVDNEKKHHCCLAVLTEVAIKNGCEDVRLVEDRNREGKLMDVVVEVRDDDRDSDGAIASDEGGSWFEYSDGDLPHVVAQWAGITSHWSNPVLDGEGAIQRNDENRETFAQIADAIEATDWGTP